MRFVKMVFVLVFAVTFNNAFADDDQAPQATKPTILQIMNEAQDSLAVALLTQSKIFVVGCELDHALALLAVAAKLAPHLAPYEELIVEIDFRKKSGECL